MSPGRKTERVEETDARPTPIGENERTGPADMRSKAEAASIAQLAVPRAIPVRSVYDQLK